MKRHFNRWTIINANMPSDKKNKYVLCECDCGNIRLVQYLAIKSGASKSCGCLRGELQTKHDLSHSRFYHIWANMKQRCNNEKHIAYYKYGGRGIKVCKGWSVFNNFKKDMYRSYLKHIAEFGEKNTSIDRINNNGNYRPKNCKWSTMKEQNNNTRKTVIINGLGTEALANKFGIKRNSILFRFHHGWTTNEITSNHRNHKNATTRRRSKLIDYSLFYMLSEREAEILHLRYGEDGSTSKTMKEVGDLIGVTRERIRQIEKRALNKMGIDI